MNIQTIYNKGHDLVANKKPEEALSYFVQVIAYQPEHANALLFLAIIHAIKGNSTQSMAFYHKAELLKPDSALAWYYWGNVNRNKKNYDAELRCYINALASKPDYSEVWNNLSIRFRTKGNAVKAVRCLIKGLTIKPDNVDAWYNLGHLFKDANSQSNAIVAWQQAAKLGDKDSQQNLARLGKRWDDQDPKDFTFAFRSLKFHDNEITIEEIMSEIDDSNEDKDAPSNAIISKLEKLAKANDGRIVSSSLAEHFSEIVELLDTIGAERNGSKTVRGANGRNYIFDMYTLPNGTKIEAGYAN